MYVCVCVCVCIYIYIYIYIICVCMYVYCVCIHSSLFIDSCVFCLSCVFLYVFIHNNKLLYFVAPNQPLSRCLDVSFHSEVKFAS